MVTMLINEKPVTFEVDTGATVTIISQEVCPNTFPNLKLKPSSVLLRLYTGNQVPVQGEAQLTSVMGNREVNLHCMW